MTIEESYFAVHATASTEIATAHSESAWAALLSGDLNAALAAEPRYIDVKTGEKISRRAAERHFAATASATKPSTVEEMDALAAQIYRPGSRWGEGRRS